MSFCSLVSRAGFVSLVAFTAFVAPVHASLNAPPEIVEALGWEPASSSKWRSPESSFYNVTSEPGAWKKALALTEEWQADAIGFDAYPADAVFRKLTRLQALVLNAKQPGVLEIIRQENAGLLPLSARVRKLPTSENGDRGRTISVANRLEQLNATLTSWLQEYPEAQIAKLTEQIKSIENNVSHNLFAGYGSERRLAELIDLGRRQKQLVDALERARNDTTKPEPARSVAIREAAGKLGYFNAYNAVDADWVQASSDPYLRAYFQSSGYPDEASLYVGDLLPLIGEERMTELLKRAYATQANISLDMSSTTGELALKLFQNGELKPARTPWSLLTWPRNADRVAAHELVVLHDRLKEKSPLFTTTHPGDRNFARTSAIAGFAYALAVEGRTDEAVQLLRGVGAGSRGFGYRGNPTQEVASIVWDLIEQVADADASKEVWDQLKQQALEGKRSADLIALAARRASEAAPGSALAQRWQMRHGWALIATERVDEGLAILAPENGLLLNGLPLVEVERDQSKDKDDRGASFVAIFKLLNALPKPEIAARVTKQLTVEFQDPNNAVWTEKELEQAFIKQLFHAGNYALSQNLLRARIAALSQKAALEKAADSARSSDGDEAGELTIQLADALGRAGDHAGVVELLAASPNWVYPDLPNYLNRDYGREGLRPLPLIAAESLNAVGRRPDAIGILEAFLARQGGNDPVYALYIQIAGQGALPFLENLYASDRFEERPLIWKAVLQLQAGKVNEAEATVKKAIAIDPSDGEQPKGDRMRAYAVLREVALKKGDAKQAAFLADVVAAIRRSENADDLSRSGLTSRAISEYDAALNQFGDAYCIQSRIARELASAGRTEEAAEHYKRAFELMPDSFGRVESHCFGCEGAFYEEVAQTVAERVLIEMTTKPNVKPQVYYLLGYLRLQQKRWAESAQYFQQATTADPDYLNAWKKLEEVLRITPADRELRDRVALALLRITPTSNHSSSNLERVSDFPGLWKVYAETAAVEEVVPSQIFPLGDRAPGATKRNDYPRVRTTFRRLNATNPGERVSEMPVLRELRYSLLDARIWGND